MRKNPVLKAILLLTLLCIFLPMLLILLWSFVARWPWPDLTPAIYSMRTFNDLLFRSNKLIKLLGSSFTLAAATALCSTLIGIMTARATELYSIRFKNLVYFGSLLPLLIPGAVFSIGVHILFIRLGLTDTWIGVLICHIIGAVPYCMTIMTDLTASVGDRLEEQAMVLGANPLRAFLHGSLPQLVPGILSSMSMAFILSYSQYFITLLIGGGKVKTIALVLVPYIQSGDRPLASIYSMVYVLSALAIFFIIEYLMHLSMKRGES
ncbi:MAG: ABC transporter permease subunit [Oscillospiraceae bacterium]|nr:ABC transporter permease subunit [Oscillospiraceae bacterium]